MSSMFTLLFLAAFSFLVWGLVHPKSLSRLSRKPLTRKEATLGFGILTFSLMILTGVTAPKSSLAPTVDTTKATTALAVAAESKAEKLPVVTTRTITETQPVPFTSSTVPDATTAKGTSKITTPGVDGVKTFTYELTYTDGKQTSKKLIKEEVTTQPIAQVTAVGTYVKPAATAQTQRQPQPTCDTNYTGACVPNVYPDDVDCGGGTGNGPYYVYGKVYVVGVDRYGLDGDGNGEGCQ